MDDDANKTTSDSYEAKTKVSQNGKDGSKYDPKGSLSSIDLDSEISNDNNQNQERVPEELQLEEVDMENPEMDPLEWTARKVIPIPKTYYWDVRNSNDVETKTKAWHHTVHALGKLLRAAESAGEVVANLTGVTNSDFAYVTDTMTEEDWEEARMHDEEKRRKRAEWRRRREEGAARKTAAASELTDEAV